MNADALYFAALLRSSSTTPKALRMVHRDHLSETWRPVFDYIMGHVREQGALPHAETVEAACQVILGHAPEGLAYYADAIRQNAMRVCMEDGFTEQVVGPLATGEADAALRGAKQVISDVRRQFRGAGHGTLDYNANTDIRWRDYELRSAAKGVLGLPLPFETLTSSTGGLLPAEVWVVCARPNMGKSWLLILMAIALYQAGLRVLFCSMETPAQGRLPRDQRHRVVRGRCIRCRLERVSPSDPCPAAEVNRQRLSVRFDALGARVSAWRLLKGCLQPQEKERFKLYLDIARDPLAGGYGWGDLRIVSPPDIVTLSDLELEVSDFQPDVVFWDSAYLGAERRSRQQMREAYNDLLIGFKALLDREGVPGVASWHFSRDVKEKATTATLGETAYTDELGRLTDVVVGLFRPPEVQRAREAILRTLKVRDGVRMPELKTKWDITGGIDFAELGAGDEEG